MQKGVPKKNWVNLSIPHLSPMGARVCVCFFWVVFVRSSGGTKLDMNQSHGSSLSLSCAAVVARRLWMTSRWLMGAEIRRSLGIHIYTYLMYRKMRFFVEKNKLKSANNGIILLIGASVFRRLEISPSSQNIQIIANVTWKRMEKHTHKPLPDWEEELVGPALIQHQPGEVWRNTCPIQKISQTLGTKISRMKSLNVRNHEENKICISLYL